MNFDNLQLGIAPFVSPIWILGFGAIALISWVIYLRNQGAAPLSRFGLFGLAILLLLNPTINKNVTTALPDVIAIVHDNSSSMRATNRQEETQTALARLTKSLQKLPNVVVKTVPISDSSDGTRIVEAISQATSGYAQDQIAGVIYIGDGLVKDSGEIAKPYPLHQILIGENDEKDRWIELISSPIAVDVGQNAEVIFKIDENRPRPDFARVSVRLGSAPPQIMNAKLGQETKIQIPINTRGKIPIAIEVAPAPGEITTNNNLVISQIEGTRNRLQVLLVTGSPYEGARAWRNLLKSDPNVELVHFTILRNADSEDVGEESESSLIPFPTEELFLEKLSGFDLIVFDRFKRIDILPDIYLEQVAKWVEEGGAFLMLAGPAEAQNSGIMTTPLVRIMPFTNPTVFEETMFKARLTPFGELHPITRPFTTSQNQWGGWNRLLRAEPMGDVLLSANTAPLLIVREAGDGRVAAILSDRSWLWQRGFDGGGPFRALFQRVAHWLMKEPALSANSLTITQNQRLLGFTYKGLQTEPDVEIITPDGTQAKVLMQKTAQNEFRGEYIAPNDGLYMVKNGQELRYVNIGGGHEVTAQDLRATHQAITRATKSVAGGKHAYIGRAGNGVLPQFRQIEARDLVIGNWFGLRKNNYRAVLRAQSEPLLPPIGLAIVIALLGVFMWWREGSNRAA